MQSRIRRRRIIKSGHFGSQFRFDDAREKKEGLMTVTRNITSGITPSSDNPCIGAKKVIYFNLSYVIYRPDLLHSSTATSTSGRGPSNIHKKPLLLLRKSFLICHLLHWYLVCIYTCFCLTIALVTTVVTVLLCFIFFITFCNLHK